MEQPLRPSEIFDFVINEACWIWGTTISNIKSKSRKRRHCLPRHAVALILSVQFDFTHEELAYHFKMEQSTFAHACQSSRIH